VDAEALGFFIERMDDDLDTPAAVACIFDLAKRANAIADVGDKEAGKQLALTAAVLCGALGLELNAGTDDEPDDETRVLAEQREQARASGDFERSDALRDNIRKRGWEVEDSSEGSRLHRP
jgi:cysteinyl-tRNA synthetase